MNEQLDDVAVDDQTARFRRYRETRDRTVRNGLIELHQGLAYHFAARYKDRGLDLDDLRQVAVLGLVKAVERFDPDRGVAFATFARPYIVGELRHHFRDASWEVHVPRSLKERSQLVRVTEGHLRASGVQEPTVKDIADEAGLTVEEVLEGMDVARSTRTTRFEAQGSSSSPFESHPSVDEGGYPEVERRLLLDGLIADLDERDRQIVVRRFVEERSQQEIADELGVSQVHVSRLLKRILEELEGHLSPQDAAE